MPTPSSSSIHIAPRPIGEKPRQRRVKWWGVLWRTVRVFFVAYLVILLLAMWFEESLIFFPLKFPAGEWDSATLPIEDATFTAADGTQLHGWYVPHPQPTAQILFLHGNAGNITHRLDALERLHHDVGASVLILDYRGYGKSEGSPNERGVLQDARAARKWLAERAGVQESEIVLLGESIGGGVAVDLAAEVSPRALVLQNCFTSVPDVAAVHYPFLPARWVMDTRLNSLAKIKKCAAPLYQCHGTSDEVIPYEQGQTLFAASPARRKIFHTHQGSGHNDPLPSQYYVGLREFLAQQ